MRDQHTSFIGYHGRPRMAHLAPRPGRVEVRSPVRVDLGMGGISDIPPWTNERVGRAVSLCALIGHEPPVRCIAEVIAEPEIQLTIGERLWSRDYHNVGGTGRGAYLYRYRSRLPYTPLCRRGTQRSVPGLLCVCPGRRSATANSEYCTQGSGVQFSAGVCDPASSGASPWMHCGLAGHPLSHRCG